MVVGRVARQLISDKPIAELGLAVLVTRRDGVGVPLTFQVDQIPPSVEVVTSISG
jgi:hypothetical protein